MIETAAANDAPLAPAAGPSNLPLLAGAATGARVATIRGEALLEMPPDLYIPPDALEVFLDTFEGPLDLLLYLIRKANIDILDIPMARLTEQYLEYVELMRRRNLELAAEYLLMAALLMEIKSRMLLPRPRALREEEARQQAELIARQSEEAQKKQERRKKAKETPAETPAEPVVAKAVEGEMPSGGAAPVSAVPVEGTLHKPMVKPAEKAGKKTAKKPPKQVTWSDDSVKKRGIKTRGDVTGGLGWRERKDRHARHKEETAQVF